MGNPELYIPNELQNGISSIEITPEGYDKILDGVIQDLKEMVKNGVISEEDWMKLYNSLGEDLKKLISLDTFKGDIQEKLGKDIYENPETFLLLLALDPDMVLEALLVRKGLDVLMKEVGISIIIKKLLTIALRLPYFTVMILDEIVKRIKLYLHETKQEKLFQGLKDDWYLQVIGSDTASHRGNIDTLHLCYKLYLRVKYEKEGTPEYQEKYQKFLGDIQRIPGE